MRPILTLLNASGKTAYSYLSKNQFKGSFTFLFLLPLMIFLFAGISTIHAQVSVINTWLDTEKYYEDPCDIDKGWWDSKYLTLKSGIEDGDTIHLDNCQDPWGISASDLVYYKQLKYLKFCRTPQICKVRSRHSRYCSNRRVRIKTFCYLEELPEDAPEDMYQLWRYEFTICDDYCGRTYTLNYYLAMYDHGAPIYQCFPNDTTIASVADLPPVDEKVKIMDVCQYVAWDSVSTEAIVDTTSGDTTCFVRTWSAGDPSGNESSKSQKIWINSVQALKSANLSATQVLRSSRPNEDWKVYPNPANERIQLQIHTDEALNYRIFNTTGKSVLSGTYLQGQQIDINALGAGVYYLQLREQGNLLGSKRLVLME